MRFLYGDSTPFPLGFNFLATLEAFMAAATRLVQLEQESSALARQTDETALARQRGLEALEAFHNVVMKAVGDTAQKVQHAHALDYARRVGDYAAQYVDEHRRTVQAATDQEQAHVVSENDRRVAEQRVVLERFLKTARLPVAATRLTVETLQEGKETSLQAHALFDNTDGIHTSFALAPERGGWTAPRKVSELLDDVVLTVGVDKSWLRGTVTPKQVSVDAWTITAFELDEDTFGVELRKKLHDKESLHVHVTRRDGLLAGHYESRGGAADQPLGTVPVEDLAQLERLWLALKTTTRDLLDQKAQLTAVTLDKQDVFASRLLKPLVARFVQMFAPTVREIAQRSSNEHELSLKHETDAGRREELYLRKEQLTGQLQPLSTAGRQVFAPLGLDTWLPHGASLTPPPVGVGPSSQASAASSMRPPAAPPSAPSSGRVLPEGS